jgi:hypothetical protein
VPDPGGPYDGRPDLHCHDDPDRVSEIERSLQEWGQAPRGYEGTMDAYYFVGLDLGQTADFTALAVLERPALPRGSDKTVYGLRHLQRFPLGTAYTRIVPAVAKLVTASPLAGHVSLVVDQTGVGRAVVDMLKIAAQCHVVPVTITGGQSVTEAEDGSKHVPKKDLVTDLQLLLQSRWLRIARSLPEADTLVRELENFRVKITLAAHETFGAWREGQHDDLVLAAALAGWWAERGYWGPFEVTEDPKSRSILADIPEGVFMTSVFADDERW